MANNHFLFAAERAGGHSHITVRCSARSHDRVLAGRFILRNEEWDDLKRILMAGSCHPDVTGTVDMEITG